MAHHNFDLPESEDEALRMARDGLREEYEKLEQRSALARILGGESPDFEVVKLGATGKYPEGRYGEHDEGEIKFAVAADAKNQKVLIDFGKPVHSLGLTPEQAVELAELLHAKAWAARGIEGK
jgi:hypothetical protein